MRGQVRSWWLNALVITTVLWMWATLAAGIWIGVEIARWSSVDSQFTGSTCLDGHYDEVLQLFVDANGNSCE